MNKSYHLTCTPGHVATQFNRHGNCSGVIVDTTLLGKFWAACISVELTTFLPAFLRMKRNIVEGVADILRPMMSNAGALYAFNSWNCISAPKYTHGCGCTAVTAQRGRWLIVGTSLSRVSFEIEPLPSHSSNPGNWRACSYMLHVSCVSDWLFNPAIHCQAPEARKGGCVPRRSGAAYQTP